MKSSELMNREGISQTGNLSIQAKANLEVLLDINANGGVLKMKYSKGEGI